MKIALTGGIASGKSTVIKMIDGLGIPTASADAYAKDVFWEPETQLVLAGLLGTGSEVTPAQLRVALAADEELRREVNSIMHPRVHAMMSSDSAIFHEVPLLFEACMQSDYDAVWVVACGPENQLQRLEKRVGNLEALNLIRTQLTEISKRVMADCIIDSSVSESETFSQVIEQVKAYGIPLVETEQGS